MKAQRIFKILRDPIRTLISKMRETSPSINAADITSFEANILNRLIESFIIMIIMIIFAAFLRLIKNKDMQR